VTERLLQFIWQFQYFNMAELILVSGEPLRIIVPGQFNTNQGPDFTDAKIVIGQTLWAGSIELHIKTSDWAKHHHQTDHNYKNVILHVVWENDQLEQDSSSQIASPVIPLLELQSRISSLLLSRYEELMDAASFIPCEKLIQTVPPLQWISWKERLLAERLMRKSKTIAGYLQQNNFHWEETFWWMLARNFGMKVNADAFEAIARSIPLNILAKQKHQIHQLEALLLGQAGLLESKFTEDYPALLQKEYYFLKNKYSLRPIHEPLLFLRMRPGNFPTIRLAQLAMLVKESVHLFSRIADANSVRDVKGWLDVTANDYWHYHYRFDEISSFKIKRVGTSMINSVIINTVVPVLFSYGNYHGEKRYKDKALHWLEESESEVNSITAGFQQIGIENKNAYDSQSVIELKTKYCDIRKCLDCGVGNFLLKRL
jgi:hypothetical protein